MRLRALSISGTVGLQCPQGPFPRFSASVYPQTSQPRRMGTRQGQEVPCSSRVREKNVSSDLKKESII